MNSILISILQFLPSYTYRCSWKTMGFFFLPRKTFMGRNKHQEMGQQLMGPLEPIEMKLRGTPGGPVVKTWPSNARGVDSIPSQRAAIRHASWPKKTKTLKRRRRSKEMKLKSINICPKGTLIFKWEVSDPHLASSNTHYLCLLEARRSSQRPCSGRSHNLLPFPNIILLENNIITKAAIIQLHCLCRRLLRPDFPFRQSPMTQLCYCAYQTTSWKVRVVEKWNSKQPVSYHTLRKAVPLVLNQ